MNKCLSLVHRTTNWITEGLPVIRTRSGRRVQFRAGSSGLVKQGLNRLHNVTHIASTGSLMASILTHPNALPRGAWFNPRLGKASCIQPTPEGPTSSIAIPHSRKLAVR
jgi:hypothetical protein